MHLRTNQKQMLKQHPQSKSKDALPYSHEHLSSKFVSRLDPYKEENSKDHYWKERPYGAFIEASNIIMAKPSGINCQRSCAQVYYQ